MIGLIFLLILIFWVLFSIYIGKEIPVWCKMKHPKIMALICIPLVFFAPVADEIIAYPQLKKLCHEGSVIKFQNYYIKENLNQLVFTAKYYDENITLFPSSILVNKTTWKYIDIKNNKIFGLSFNYNIKETFLNVPKGSSGESMPLLIKGCNEDNGIKKQIYELNLIQDQQTIGVQK